MILAKDLLTLLATIPPESEIVVSQGRRSGLHCTHPEQDVYGWIEIGESNIVVSLDCPNHQLKKIGLTRNEGIDHWEEVL